MNFQNEKIDEAIAKLLEKKSLTLSVAESCTGGALADAITDRPGSSVYFKGGIVAYSNQVKKDLLNVTSEALNSRGAVSKPVALQMAQNIAGLMKTDIGLSTTGIAGPGGGSDEKPVGTVWIGLWSRQKHFALKALFTNDRLKNKKRTVEAALETARRVISGIEEMPEGLKPYFAE